MKRKASKEAPFINGKIVDFVPVVQEMNVWTNGELDDTAGNKLNYYIDNIKRKLDEPAIKMITGFFNNGVPLVPFPQVQRCLGLIPEGSHLEIKEGYAVMAFDYNVKRSSQDCLFNMNDQVLMKEQSWLEQERRRLRGDGKTLDITQFAVWAQNAAEKVSNLGLPADLMKDINEKGFDGIKDAASKFDRESLQNSVDAGFKFAEDNKHHFETAK